MGNSLVTVTNFRDDVRQNSAQHLLELPLDWKTLFSFISSICLFSFVNYHFPQFLRSHDIIPNLSNLPGPHAELAIYHVE